MTIADGPVGTLDDERQALARSRILHAGRVALRDIGAHVTVDEVAILAKVARRTVFRYFPTRDELIASVLLSIMDDYVSQLPRAEGYADLDTWLSELAERAHTLNGRLGSGYWQLLVAPDGQGPIADAIAERLRRRKQLSRDLADQAWSLAGNRGKPGDQLESAFALTLGPLATAVLTRDLGMTPLEAARLSINLLLPLIEQRKK